MLFVETFIIGLIVATALYASRYQLLELFVNGDQELLDLSLAVMPFFCWYGVPVDAALQTLQGGVRALGIQTIGSVVAICSYYLVSLPLAYVLAFVLDLKLKGFWYG